MASEINCVCTIVESGVKVCYPPTNSNSSGGVQSVVAGTNITVDNTDPQNPIVSSSGGGIIGTGTVNYIPKIATVDGVDILTLEDSAFYDDGTNMIMGRDVVGGQASVYTQNGSIISSLTLTDNNFALSVSNPSFQSSYIQAVTSANSQIDIYSKKIFITADTSSEGSRLSLELYKAKLETNSASFDSTLKSFIYINDGDAYLQTFSIPSASVGFVTVDATGKLGFSASAGGGTTTNPLTIGTGLSGTSFNGSSPVTIAIDSSVVTLTGSQALSNKTGLISQWTNDAGYLTSLSGAVTSVSGTANRITSTGGATPVIDISASYVGQSSITTIGTLSSGAVPASLVTAGTFGSGAYTMGTSLTTPSLIGVSGAQAYSTTAQSSGAITDFTFTPSNHTGQTASTNSPVFKIAASTKTLAAGTVSAFYGTSIESTTVSFASASTITNGYNLFVDSFPTGTNATVTNPYSIGTNGFIRIAAGSTTQGTIIRNDTTINYGAIYNGNVTPSNSNFAIKYNGITTFVNGATGGSLFLTYNAGSVVNISGPTAFGFADGVNVSTGTTTGTKFGTATSQKIAFFNKTPIIQPTTGITGATLVGGGGTTITSTDTFGGYTLQQLAAVIINLGLAA